jgi:hypothetical protein
MVRTYRTRRGLKGSPLEDYILDRLADSLADGTFGQPLPAGPTCPACGHRAHPDGCAETPDSECTCDGSEV